MKYISWVVCVDGVNEEFKTLKDITAKYPLLTRQRVSYKANHCQNLRKSKIDKNITIKKVNNKPCPHCENSIIEYLCPIPTPNI